MKTILHLCSGSGSDSQPYVDAGYNVIRISKEVGVENFHPPVNVHGIIANPPCTEFSFARTNSKVPRDISKGLDIVRHCLRIIWECQMDVPTLAKKTSLAWWMLENPFGLLRRYLGHPALIYQPFEYGDDYKKKTCVWGFFKMPKKSPIECTKPKFDKLKTKEIHPEYYGSLTRQERRSLCSPRFAKEFFKANQ